MPSMLPCCTSDLKRRLQRFPVRLRREFISKPLNSLADGAPNRSGWPDSAKFPVLFPVRECGVETGSIRAPGLCNQKTPSSKAATERVNAVTWGAPLHELAPRRRPQRPRAAAALTRPSVHRKSGFGAPCRPPPLCSIATFRLALRGIQVFDCPLRGSKPSPSGEAKGR